eukprot:Selendium_serpulae@DN3995_c0_g1_i1.p3
MVVTHDTKDDAPAATEADTSALKQPERAFQKQFHTTMGDRKLKAKSKRTQQRAQAGKNYTFWRKVGLGFKTPAKAIEGHYIDKKCPFTGNVHIRGRIMKGMVVSAEKMKNTVVIRRHYLHYQKKYNRFEKRNTNIKAHCSPCFEDISNGDIVTLGECRPLSKFIRFNVLKVEKNQIFGAAKKQFRLF